MPKDTHRAISGSEQPVGREPLMSGCSLEKREEELKRKWTDMA